MSAKKVYFDTLRSLAYTGISGAYASVGSTLSVNPRIICFTNTTDADTIWTIDLTNSSGMIFVPAGGFKLYDLESNINPNKDYSFEIAIGTQFSVKSLTSPSKGAVYFEDVYSI